MNERHFLRGRLFRMNRAVRPPSIGDPKFAIRQGERGCIGNTRESIGTDVAT